MFSDLCVHGTTHTMPSLSHRSTVSKTMHRCVFVSTGLFIFELFSVSCFLLLVHFMLLHFEHHSVGSIVVTNESKHIFKMKKRCGTNRTTELCTHNVSCTSQIHPVMRWSSICCTAYRLWSTVIRWEWEKGRNRKQEIRTGFTLSSVCFVKCK